MFIEDARELTLAALERLESQKSELGLPDLQIWSLPEFVNFAKGNKLKRREKEAIVDQALLLVDQLYAHLPFKRARYAVDPVQRLRLLRFQLAETGDRQFHSEMIDTFVQLRDAHTFYGLPTPYRGAIAFLPFHLDFYHDEHRHRRFVVTNILQGFTHPFFAPKAEITYWNGIPVEEAIHLNADRVSGGNRAARFARGLARMTVRPLTSTLPPDEFWVVLQYKEYGSNTERAITLPWSVGMGMGNNLFRDGEAESICGPVAERAAVHHLLWGRPLVANSPEVESRLPGIFEFQYSDGLERPGLVSPTALRDSCDAGRKFGYIRIKSFDSEADEFVDEFVRILKLMKDAAPDGLILDLRGNPGGSIQAGERILQTLTPREITPALFHFINTQLTQDIGDRLLHTEAVRLQETQSQLQPWIRDFLDSVSSGTVLTDGRPLTRPADANSIGQLYQAPVVLLIDALAYSSADIFAAGFQDNAVGLIIGEDENTGGGGANRWTHEQLVTKLSVLPGLGLEPLPRDATLGVAIRRSSRVGPNAGKALEDFGVKRDIEHHTTHRDLLEDSTDLISFACRKLGEQPVYKLEILEAVLDNGLLGMTIRTKGLDRIECWLEDRPQYAAAARNDADMCFRVPLDGLDAPVPERLIMKGFARRTGEGSEATKMELAATARWSFETKVTRGVSA